MPSSSRDTEERLSACFCENSPRMREERSATSCTTLDRSSGWFIAHDAVGAGGAPGFPGIVKVVQMRDRLAHGEEGLVGIERPPEQHAEELGRALWPVHGLQQLAEACAVVRLERGDAPVSAAERLAV